MSLFSLLLIFQPKKISNRIDQRFRHWHRCYVRMTQAGRFACHGLLELFKTDTNLSILSYGGRDSKASVTFSTVVLHHSHSVLVGGCLGVATIFRPKPQWPFGTLCAMLQQGVQASYSLPAGQIGPVPSLQTEYRLPIRFPIRPHLTSQSRLRS